MRPEESRRFPQTRNGVRHSIYGDGIVTYNRGFSSEQAVMVRFDGTDKDTEVFADELASLPSRGISPDPATSRNSGWIGGNNYKRK